MAVSVVFSVRMVKEQGMKLWYYPAWTMLLVLLGGAGYMEYYVQRHGDKGLFSYTIMTLCLSFFVCLSLLFYSRTAGAEE